MTGGVSGLVSGPVWTGCRSTHQDPVTGPAHVHHALSGVHVVGQVGLERARGQHPFGDVLFHCLK